MELRARVEATVVVAVVAVAIMEGALEVLAETATTPGGEAVAGQASFVPRPSLPGCILL
jgi:hypothetical protein